MTALSYDGHKSFLLLSLTERGHWRVWKHSELRIILTEIVNYCVKSHTTGKSSVGSSVEFCPF